MLTRNLRSALGLVNGLLGGVVDIVWPQEGNGPARPELTVERLNAYDGPA